jgi:hypothetical protein
VRGLTDEMRLVEEHSPPAREQHHKIRQSHELL